MIPFFNVHIKRWSLFLYIMCVCVCVWVCCLEIMKCYPWYFRMFPCSLCFYRTLIPMKIYCPIIEWRNGRPHNFLSLPEVTKRCRRICQGRKKINIMSEGKSRMCSFYLSQYKIQTKKFVIFNTSSTHFAICKAFKLAIKAFDWFSLLQHRL